MKRLIMIIISGLLLVDCLREDDLNLPFTGFAPKDIGDGHVLSTPSREGIDSIGLLAVYRDVLNHDDFWPIRSLLVFRHSKLIAETYFKDEADISNRHLVWSCTKQFIGVLTGFAVDSGIVKSVDDPISDYFTDELNGHSDKATITIRNLLQMQSGINYNNDGIGGDTDNLLQQKPDNLVDYILSIPMNAEPGKIFHYNDGNPHLMAALLQKLIGKPVDIWADEVLFSKIGITNLNWVRYRDGITHGGYGIETTPREMAKLALFVADSGMWNNHQLLSRQWIREMTKPSIVANYHNNAMGFYWWRNLSSNLTFMSGHGGQYAFIDWEHDLIVVMTAFPNTQDDYQISDDEAIEVVLDIISTLID